MTETSPRPEPVLIAAGVASALTSLVGLVLTALVLTHVLTPAGASTLGPALAAAIPTVLGAASTIVAAFHARSRVTPLADPRLIGAAGDLVQVGQTLSEAFRTATRPAGPQTVGVPDHAAPEQVTA